MLDQYVMLAGGLVLLAVGGELLVRGAVAVAERLGMSPLLIGLTLVGFGTSTPELVTSVQAAHAGSPGIAIGNVVGSNIANILLVLGMSAAIQPIAVESNALRRDGSMVLAVSVLFTAIGWLGVLSKPVAGALVLMLVGYMWFAYRQETASASATTGDHTAAFNKAEARDELLDGENETPSGRRRMRERLGPVLPPLMALIGLAVVVLGGKLLVDSATAIARSAQISETVIGLTIVAVGTSLPEFITSLIAALRGHSAVALGNILGSNIYNILGIGGLTGLFAPGITPIPPEIASFDNIIMVLSAVALLIFAQTGFRIARIEGLALLTGYAAYIWWLWPK